MKFKLFMCISVNNTLEFFTMQFIESKYLNKLCAFQKSKAIDFHNSWNFKSWNGNLSWNEIRNQNL